MGFGAAEAERVAKLAGGNVAMAVALLSEGGGGEVEYTSEFPSLSGGVTRKH